MALPVGPQLTEEIERITPYVERLKAFIRGRDPGAQFSLQVGHVPEIWELNAYLDPQLIEEDDFWDELAQFETDLLLDHDVAVATIRHARVD